MHLHPGSIVFVDNDLHTIFRTLSQLKREFRDVHAFNDETEAFEFISLHPPDVIFMNLDLLPQDALSFSRDIIGSRKGLLPFLIIYSDKQDDFLIELALNEGIDAYIGFHLKPSVIRLFIRNLLKRKPQLSGRNDGVIVIDKDEFLIYRKGVPVQLPKKEFWIFELLYENQEKFFTKKEIARQIWQDESVAQKRLIDVHIYNIRRAFGRDLIQSGRYKGYRMNLKR